MEKLKPTEVTYLPSPLESGPDYLLLILWSLAQITWMT